LIHYKNISKNYCTGGTVLNKRYHETLKLHSEAMFTDISMASYRFNADVEYVTKRSTKFKLIMLDIAGLAAPEI